MGMLKKALLVSGLLLLVGACFAPPTQIASRYVKSVPVTASQGSTITVSAEESPELAGLTLTIPPGALTHDQTITLEVGEDAIVRADDQTAGPVAVFGPAGLTFAVPVQLTLPFQLPENRGASSLYVQVQEQDGRRFIVPNRSLSIDPASGRISLEISGFTAYQSCSTHHSACSSASDCSAGQACTQGRCEDPNHSAQDAGSAHDGGPAPDGGQVLDAGHGVCASDADCAVGQTCWGGRCASISHDGGQAPDGGQVNHDGGQATDGGPGGDGGHVGPVDGGADRCNFSSDCHSPLTCIGGYCL